MKEGSAIVTVTIKTPRPSLSDRGREFDSLRVIWTDREAASIVRNQTGLGQYFNLSERMQSIYIIKRFVHPVSRSEVLLSNV